MISNCMCMLGMKGMFGLMDKLFEYYEIRSVVIKNRIIMPPMRCVGWADENGIVSEKHIAHYEQRAKGGAGLIIVEAACFDKRGAGTQNMLALLHRVLGEAALAGGHNDAIHAARHMIAANPTNPFLRISFIRWLNRKVVLQRVRFPNNQLVEFRNYSPRQ